MGIAKIIKRGKEVSMKDKIGLVKMWIRKAEIAHLFNFSKINPRYTVQDSSFRGKQPEPRDVYRNNINI